MRSSNVVARERAAALPCRNFKACTRKALLHNEFSEVTGKAAYSFLSYSVLFGSAAVGVLWLTEVPIRHGDAVPLVGLDPKIIVLDRFRLATHCASSCPGRSSTRGGRKASQLDPDGD